MVLVDDDGTVRRAVMRLAGRGMEWQEHATYANAAAAITCAHEAPAGAIIDVNLPDGDGCELAMMIRARFPSTTVLLVSGRRLPVHTHRAYLMNVPFLLKPVSATELREFRRRVELAEGPATVIADGVQRVGARYALSPQQVRLLSLLASNASRTVISEELGITSNTLKCRIRVLLRRTEQARVRDLLRMILLG